MIHVNGQFQSTLPMRGGTAVEWDIAVDDGISIHPPHAGRDDYINYKRSDTVISIHPPHAGRDAIQHQNSRNIGNFNPPSPCGEGPFGIDITGRTKYFNPPSPCGEGPFPHPRPDFAGDFNPPSPCGEGHQTETKLKEKNIFQSTLPMRGGTKKSVRVNAYDKISIHPPHAGRDILS